jgi:flagellar biosynthesis protein FliQ
MVTGSDVYAMMSEMILASLYASGPVLAIALLLGLGIAFFQALTQIQEMTLTFVPKIIGIFLGVIAAAPFMYDQVSRLAVRAFDLIASGTL